MDLAILEEAGFSKGEVKVYFALIELGASSIGPISRKAGITPSKTYLVLQKLIDKGLVNYFMVGNAKHFQAFNPKRISDFLEERKKKISLQQEKIGRLIPELIARQKKKEFQSVTMYESFKGMQALYDEFLDYLEKRKEDFIGFALDEYKDPMAKTFFRSYDVKRRALGIRTKLIALESQRKILTRHIRKNPFIEVRYIAQSFPTGVVIIGDRVATLSWGSTPVAFVIQSAKISQSYRKFFYDLWKKAKI